MAIVDALRHWRALLVGSPHPIAIFSDRQNLMWSQFLADFNYVIVYRAGKNQVQADALWQRKQDRPTPGDDISTANHQRPLVPATRCIGALTVDDIIDRAFIERVRNAQATDPTIQALRQKLEIPVDQRDPVTAESLSNYSAKEDLLLYKNRVYVPGTELQHEALQQCHDNPTAGHFGTTETIELLSRNLYWPRLKAVVRDYLKSWEPCQGAKIHPNKPYGLLQPLTVPQRAWGFISMDFITGLPKNPRGHDAILVVADRLTKMGHFIPTTETATAEDTSDFIIRDVVRLHGPPDQIVSDRAPQFKAGFWTHFWGTLGADLQQKYERLQADMSSQLAQREARIHALEPRLQQPRTQPPTQPGSPVPGASDSEVTASLRKKLQPPFTTSSSCLPKTQTSRSGNEILDAERQSLARKADLAAHIEDAKQLKADKERSGAQAVECQRELEALGDENKRFAGRVQEAQPGLTKLEDLSRTAQQLTAEKEGFDEQRQADAQHVKELSAALYNCAGVGPWLHIFVFGRRAITAIPGPDAALLAKLDEKDREIDSLKAKLEDAEAEHDAIYEESEAVTAEQRRAPAAHSHRNRRRAAKRGSRTEGGQRRPQPSPRRHRRRRQNRDCQTAESPVHETARRIAELENGVEKYRALAEQKHSGLDEHRNGASDTPDVEAAILALLDALVAGDRGADAESPTAGWGSMDNLNHQGSTDAPLAVQGRVAAPWPTAGFVSRAELRVKLQRYAATGSTDVPTERQNYDAELVELRTKCEQAEADVKRLTGERTGLIDKLTSMKNASALKLQAEMETSARLRAELAHLQQTINARHALA
ncbi:hypothetical protein PhCBS80983_g05675 [Powellomyces hirtus]|uniref:Integrase zinc-binding domain-containing protein n=1 Tax=Powellomyces hirtus TaxID=109895 RepID=A0A507DT63_9FUNG|nr:hypothetical protein PhCBS80983_g05675 [Powellomyces hirtus]